MNKRITALATLITLALAATAYASSGGEEGGDVMHVVWQVFNFAVLVFVLVYFGRKPFRDFLSARSEAIRKSLDEARAARELAEQALEEVKIRLQTKDAEVQAIIEAARASGEREREALVEEGKRMSEKLLEQARRNIEFERDKASASIRAEAVEIAMELAERKLKEKLSDEDKGRLFEEALARLEDGN